MDTSLSSIPSFRSLPGSPRNTGSDTSSYVSLSPRISPRTPSPRPPSPRPPSPLVTQPSSSPVSGASSAQPSTATVVIHQSPRPSTVYPTDTPNRFIPAPILTPAKLNFRLSPKVTSKSLPVPVPKKSQQAQRELQKQLSLQKTAETKRLQAEFLAKKYQESVAKLLKKLQDTQWQLNHSAKQDDYLFPISCHSSAALQARLVQAQVQQTTQRRIMVEKLGFLGLTKTQINQWLALVRKTTFDNLPSLAKEILCLQQRTTRGVYSK